MQLAINFSEELLLQWIEALIFASDEPLSVGRIILVLSESFGIESIAPEHIAEAVEKLNARYKETQSALHIYTWASGFRMGTVEDVQDVINTLFAKKERKNLSRTLIETLAVIAYRQPVTRPEIEFIRGVNADYGVKKLMELGFVEVKGRSDAVGQPLVYGTTPFFLEQFGLASLEALPNIREIAELLDDPAFDKERAELLLAQRTESWQELTENDDEKEKI